MSNRKQHAIDGASRDEGVALVLALLFVVLLTALVVDFNYEMQVAASAVGNHTDDLQAYLAAKSAVAAGMGMLATDLFENEELASLGEVEDVFDSFDDLWSDGIPLAPLNEAIMQCQIDDEYGKINLNAMVYGPEDEEQQVVEPIAEMLRILFEYRGMDPTPVDAIIDWLDSDDDTTDPDGFEYDYYESLQNPYGCKNGPMDSIEELLLIPGITPEMYFGDPEAGFDPLPDLLTVHGHPLGKINVNTARYEVLVAYFALTDSVSPEESTDALLTRLEEEGPFTGRSGLEQAGLSRDKRKDDDDDDRDNDRGARKQARAEEEDEEDREGEEEDGRQGQLGEGDMFDWASSAFRIRGDGQSGNAQVRIEAYVWRDTFASGSAQTMRVIDWRVFR